MDWDVTEPAALLQADSSSSSSASVPGGDGDGAAPEMHAASSWPPLAAHNRPLPKSRRADARPLPATIRSHAASRCPPKLRRADARPLLATASSAVEPSHPLPCTARCPLGGEKRKKGRRQRENRGMKIKGKGRERGGDKN